jgi:polyphosphate kinase
MTKEFVSKEISWLSFNFRVLQEAENPDVPLLERLKFLGIYSNNLDEFFRVRVAALKRISQLEKKAKELIGDDPKKVLQEIQEIVIHQNTQFEAIYHKILKGLSKENVFIVNEKQLTPEQQKFVHDYFFSEVRANIFPIILDQSEIFPDLKDDEIYLAVCLVKYNRPRPEYALIQVPTKYLPRFIELPHNGPEKYIILLDDVIRFGLEHIFYIFDYDIISAYTIKLTKDAELDINDDVSESYVKKVTRSLRQRQVGQPVRFIYDEDISKGLLNFIKKKLNFKNEDVVIPGGRYHNFKDFMNFPDLNKPYLKYSPQPPVSHRQIVFQKGIFATIREKDILLHYPYQSFTYFIDLLREASIDPKVESISITLYRLATNSSVINALLNAMKNGKQVTAVVELQARFSEEANIYWSNVLREEGAKVIYGAYDLKVHSKLCLITRKENKKSTYYACVGTGNFNEETTKVFSDHMLITYDKKITLEISKMFSFFDKNYKLGPFNHIMVSPFSMRKRITRHIENEILNAKAGKTSGIFIKINNLDDKKIIEKLYEANEAGVEIKLIVRGMCSLKPNYSKQYKNIKVISIVDKYLEHSRIFVFNNNGDELFYISSADLMLRNLDRRIEVTCPIYDKDIQSEIKHFLEIQWKDNQKARVINNKQNNKLRSLDSDKPIRSQVEIYKWIKEMNEVQTQGISN